MHIRICDQNITIRKIALVRLTKGRKNAAPRVTVANRPLGPTPDRGALPFNLEILCKNAYLALSWFGPKRIRR